MNNNDALAIIIARAGSKRIPGKNIRNFHGRPIISWVIDTALNSKLFKKVIVSTDSEQIAAIARNAGAEIPFMRPAELADDFSPTQDVILHALREMGQQGEIYPYACCLYPTSVFLSQEILRKGYEKISDPEFQLVMSVTDYDFPIQRALLYKDNGSLAYANPEHELTRSNDLPTRVHDAAQFYWLKTKPFLKSSRLFSGTVGGVKVLRKNIIDIDTEEDWEIAERIWKLEERLGTRESPP